MHTLISTCKRELYLIWNFDKLVFENRYGQFQNTLRYLEIKLYRCMLILVYRFATWNMKQKTCYIEVQRLDAFENSALKKIFRKKREEVCNRNMEKASD